jgi:hypothetical protein
MEMKTRLEVHEVTGEVSRTSPHGFQLNGNDEWFNYGNFYKGDKANKGDNITVRHTDNNGRRYVKAISLSGSAQTQTTQLTVQNVSAPTSHLSASGAAKDLRISRLSLLRSGLATEYFKAVSSSEGKALEEAVNETLQLVKRLEDFVNEQ